MAEIGVITCLTADANQGVGTCPFEPGLLKLPIAIPKGAHFTDSDISAGIDAFITGKIFHNTDTLRWLPHPELVGIEDGTTEGGVEQYSFGPSEDVGADFPVWTGKFRKGKLCAYQNARNAFHRKNERYDWLWMDDQGRIIGRKKVVDNVTYIYGLDTDSVKVHMWKPGDNSTNNDYRTTWRFSDATQLADNLIAVETGLRPSDITGVVSAEPIKVSEAADGVYNIKWLTKCGKENITSTYNAELDATAAYTVTDAVGAAITFTVTWNATAGYMTFNLDETDGDYPSVGDDIIITPVSISALEALGVGDFDSGLAYQLLPITVLAT